MDHRPDTDNPSRPPRWHVAVRGFVAGAAGAGAGAILGATVSGHVDLWHRTVEWGNVGAGWPLGGAAMGVCLYALGATLGGHRRWLAYLPALAFALAVPWLLRAPRHSLWPLFAWVACVACATAGMVTPIVTKWARQLGERTARGAVGVGVAIVALTFAVLGALQVRALSLGFGDTGIFAEAILSTLRGKFLYSNYYSFGCYLGDHWSPILLLLLPFMAVEPRAEMLLAVQSVALAAGAPAVYLLTKTALRRHASASADADAAAAVAETRLFALFLASAYLLYPPMEHLNYSFGAGFHAVALAAPLLLWAFYFLHRGKMTGFWVLILLALNCKETVAPAVAMLAPFVWIKFRRPRTAAIMFLLGIGWVLISTQVLMPWLKGGEYIYFSGYLGDSSAGRSLATTLGGSGSVFLAHLLLPLALLPLLSPLVLLSVAPTLLVLLSAEALWLPSILFHNTASVIPGLVLASVHGMIRLRKIGGDRAMRYGAVGLLWTVVLAHLLFAPAPWCLGFEQAHTVASRRSDAICKLEQFIPPAASVCATPKAALHFVDRRAIHVFPAGRESSDYVILDLYDSWSGWSAAFECRNALLRARGHAVVFRDAHVVCFRKGGPWTRPVEPMAASRLAKLHQPSRRLNDALTMLHFEVSPHGEGAWHEAIVIWRCDAETKEDFWPVISARDATTGREAQIGPYPPLDGAWPTSFWQPGEAYEDRLTVRLPFDARDAARLEVAVHLMPRSSVDAHRTGPHVDLRF